MGKRLTVLPWSCHQTGDCCKAVDAVLMTAEEAEVLRATLPADKWNQLVWAPGPPSTTGTFVKLQAFPCPLLVDGKCSVHKVRPYNCRRFICLRPDPATESLEPNHGKFGCANIDDRITDRAARRAVVVNQRRAMHWALKHGWTP